MNSQDITTRTIKMAADSFIETTTKFAALQRTSTGGQLDTFQANQMINGLNWTLKRMEIIQSKHEVPAEKFAPTIQRIHLLQDVIRKFAGIKQ